MLKITVDSREVRKMVKRWPDQAAFATSLAINNTLKVAQKVQRAHDENAFDVRNRRFVEKAIKIKPFAKKHSLVGIIRVDPPGGQARADILTKFEKGGEKRPHGAHDIAVPTRMVKRGPRGVRASQKPSAILAAGGFIGKTRSGKLAIFQRLGSGKGTRLKFMFSLVPAAHIKPRLEFVATVTRVIRTEGTKQLKAAWDKALATAKP